jgi:hypothetical protein
MVAKYNGIVDKEMEKKLVEFASTLRPDLGSLEVIELYDQIEKEHWLVSSKVLLMRTLFQSTLNEQFAKEEKAALNDMSSMFG